MSENESPDKPDDTVLSFISKLTGEEQPKVLLPESNSEGQESPFVDPKVRDSKLFPKGHGNYQVLGEVARGGMGIILKSHDTDLGRDVAMKVLDEKLLQNPAILHRFVEEAQIGGQLQHPGIVPVYEMGLMDDDRPYFTMKFVKGRTLAALLAKRKSVESDRRRFLSIFEQICQTVAYAHSKGVIHRDLKPANVMTGAFGEIQVVDWGLAKVLKGGGVADELMARQGHASMIETVRSGPGSSGSDSVIGSVMGTPAYMAPEQAMGETEKVDERADVFALGAILCEILTGQPPYVSAEKDRTVMLAAHAKLDPARERLEVCSADEELKQLCRECLAPAPVARLQNAEEVAQRIHDYLASLEDRAHKAELAATELREQRRRQRLTLILAATIVLAVFVVGFALRRMEKQAEADRREALAQVQEQVDETASQVGALQDEGRLAEALEVARTAIGLVSGEKDVDQATIDRAERMVRLAEARVADFEQRAEVAAKNSALLTRCDELRMRQIDTEFGFSPPDILQRLEEGYVTAFQEYGIDLEDEDLPAALEILRQNEIGVAAALALDDWASVRRDRYNWDSYEVEAVLALAFDLDPDPFRTRVREALLANDREALVELAQSEELGQMDPSTFWVLSEGLSYFKLEEHVFAVVQRGVDLFPQDFLLNFQFGNLLYGPGRHRAALEHLVVARTLRPDNASVWSVLGDNYNAQRYDERAFHAYSRALELNPELKKANGFIGVYALWSGHYEESFEALTKGLEVVPNNSEWLFGHRLSQALTGRISMAEVADGLPGDSWEMAPLVTSLFLVGHPDREQRDPRRALAILEPGLDESDSSAKFITVARAWLLLGEYEQAETILERLDTLEYHISNQTDGMRQLILAAIHHHRGQPDLALKRFERAKESMDQRLFYGWEAIEGSALESFYREIEALVKG